MPQEVISYLLYDRHLPKFQFVSDVRTFQTRLNLPAENHSEAWLVMLHTSRPLAPCELQTPSSQSSVGWGKLCIHRKIISVLISHSECYVVIEILCSISVCDNIPTSSFRVLCTVISLWLYSPLDLGNFFSFLIHTQSVRLLEREVGPSQGPLPTHRTTQTQNKSTQTSMPGVGFEPTIPVFERAKTVHALDRAAKVIRYFGVFQFL
jgi:hypothetical protein